jgi:hypothetical protein
MKHMSHIGGKGRCAKETRVSHHSKGRRTLWRYVSLLLNMQKKEYLQIIFHGILLAPTCRMPVGMSTCMYVCQQTRVVPVQEAQHGAQAV